MGDGAAAFPGKKAGENDGKENRLRPGKRTEDEKIMHLYGNTLDFHKKAFTLCKADETAGSACAVTGSLPR